MERYASWRRVLLLSQRGRTWIAEARPSQRRYFFHLVRRLVESGALFDICAASDLASLNRGRRNNRLASERYRAGRARRSDHARWCTSFVATNNPWSSRSVAAQRLLRRRSTRGRLPLRSGRDAQDRRRTGDTVVADPSFGPSTRGTAWPAPALGKLRRLDELYRIHEATAMRSMEWRAEGR